MPDRVIFAECDNCGTRGQFTLDNQKRILPAGWVTLSNTISGTALFDTEVCRDAWTSSRQWRRAVDDFAVQELQQIEEARSG